MYSAKKSILRIIVTVIGLVIITPVMTIPMLLSSLFIKPGKFAFLMMRTWNRTVAKMMGIRYSLSGMNNLVPKTSYIITPNHQGVADIVSIVSSLPLYFRWVVKKELLKVPVWGWALWATGAIAIDRSNSATAIEKLNREKDTKLQDGWSMLIYPEGTRTPDGFLKELKKGAFMMAIQTGIPILPIVCNGAFKIMPKKMLAFRPGLVKLTICPPIPTLGLSEKDLPELMEKTRQAILSRLRPDYDPFKNQELCSEHA
ncbi:MAG: lysophospholipid acyltransferase family protein [Desulfomonilaceae bacterium]